MAANSKPIVSIRGLIKPVSIRAIVGIETPELSANSACDHFKAALPERMAALNSFGLDGRNI
jgi:hypothetical protein